jgi:uncharacterized membrane protein YkvA (DUF1232 family)
MVLSLPTKDADKENDIRGKIGIMITFVAKFRFRTMENVQLIDIWKDTNSYRKHYVETKFWMKIQLNAKKAGAKAVYYALLLYYAVNSPDMSFKEKAKIYGVLGYFIFPVDLIPDFILGTGYADDIALFILMAKTIAKHITPETELKAKAKLSELGLNYDN